MARCIKDKMLIAVDEFNFTSVVVFPADKSRSDLRQTVLPKILPHDTDSTGLNAESD